MRMLLPHPAAEIDVVDTYAVSRPPPPAPGREPGPDRPWTIALMASTADGAAAVEGRSGAIGGAGDKEVFRAVRAVADAVVVGAGTVTAERYGPIRTPADLVSARVERDQQPHPRAVVVSGRLSLDPGLPLFAEAHADTEADPDAGTDHTTPRPLVVHGPGAPASSREALAPVADLVELGAGDGGGVDPVALLSLLHQQGHQVVVAEGGPTLNGALVAADLIDELCLTLDPMVVGGHAPRIATADGPPAARAWRPAHLLEHDGALFWRLLRDRTT